MIDSIRIQNIRSLKDTGDVPIKRLNLLVGSNSSGKSTFLRSFLLLAQSANKLLRNAIAWFDESLVDFGDYMTTKTKDSADESIIVTLRLSDCDFEYPFWRTILPFPIMDNTKPFMGAYISIHFTYIQDTKKDYISKVQITFNNGSEVVFLLDDKSKKVSVFANSKILPWINLRWESASSKELLPEIEFKVESAKSFNEFQQWRKDILLQALAPLKKDCGKTASHFEKLEEYLEKWRLDKTECLEEFKKVRVFSALTRNISQWEISNTKFNEVYNNILGVFALCNWFYVSTYVSNVFTSCDYIAPLRAEANRYYRNVGMQVERVDSYGRNLAEFIDSLTQKQKQSYDDYITNSIKARIQVRNNTGHQSIVITPKNDNEDSYDSEKPETNLIDTGFGYSQILPILTKLWWIQQRKRFRRGFYNVPSATVLIEQPELHLHPALQAKLADVFIKAAINQEAKTNLIIETHSSTIINRIGRRIREGHIKPEDVNIIYFEKDRKTGYSKIRSTDYDGNGRIKEWPYGFLEPDDDPF